MDIIEKIKQKGFSPKEVSEGSGIPLPRVYKWMQGKSSPKAEDSRILEKFLQSYTVKDNTEPIEMPETVANLSHSVKTVTETNSRLVVELIERGKKETEVTIASAVPVLEIIAKEGKGRWWQSVDEGRKELGSML